MTQYNSWKLFLSKSLQMRECKSRPILQLVLSREASKRALRVVEVWRRGTPISQAFTFAANLKEHNDSCSDFESGAIFTNMSVFESPPKQG